MQDLVSWPGTELGGPALGAWSLNHWTSREVPTVHYYKCFLMRLLGVWKLFYTSKMIKNNTVTDLRKTLIGSKAKLPPTSLPPQNKGCHCISHPVLIHTLFLPITAMPTTWIFLMSLAWVCRLTSILSPFLSIVSVSSGSLFKCPWLPPLLFRWIHQNENFSASTLLYPKTRQNSTHKMQAVRGSPGECHCALVSRERRGAPDTNPLWLS